MEIFLLLRIMYNSLHKLLWVKLNIATDSSLWDTCTLDGAERTSTGISSHDSISVRGNVRQGRAVHILLLLVYSQKKWVWVQNKNKSVHSLITWFLCRKMRDLPLIMSLSVHVVMSNTQIDENMCTFHFPTMTQKMMQ